MIENRKEINALIISIAIWGIIFIGSGTTMALNKKITTETTYELSIENKQISEIQAKINEVILKDIELEEGTPISANIRDYLVEPDKISDTLLRQLSQGINTSQVNINQPGTYTYTITCNKKIYKGTITIKAKELPNVEITLKAKKLPTTGTLSRNIRDYVYENENITEEVYNNMILDLDEVAEHLGTPGKYKYKVIYKDTTYTGDFDILEPVSTGNSNTCPIGTTKENNTCKCNDPTKTYDQTTKTCK